MHFSPVYNKNGLETAWRYMFTFRPFYTLRSIKFNKIKMKKVHQNLKSLSLMVIILQKILIE